MRGNVTRILSDVHYGDRASRVARLTQLQPLLGDVDAVVFNGDTVDTRPGPFPAHTAECRRDVLAFAAGAPVTFLTGNHDPDLSTQHSLDLNGGEIFVVHGDVLFDDIVPWGRDADFIRTMLARTLGTERGAELIKMPLERRLRIWRDVAASIPQRHQSERHPLKYAVRFFADTVWPPTRFLKIFDAWHREPRLATELARHHRPKARYLILGHTHRPAIRRLPGGPIVINTGSFTAPFGGYAVDVHPGRLEVRRVRSGNGEFRPGNIVAEFPLANR